MEFEKWVRLVSGQDSLRVALDPSRSYIPQQSKGETFPEEGRGENEKNAHISIPARVETTGASWPGPSARVELAALATALADPSSQSASVAVAREDAAEAACVVFGGASEQGTARDGCAQLVQRDSAARTDTATLRAPALASSEALASCALAVVVSGALAPNDAFSAPLSLSLSRAVVFVCTKR